MLAARLYDVLSVIRCCSLLTLLFSNVAKTNRNKHWDLVDVTMRFVLLEKK